MRYSIFLPLGFAQEFAGFTDPVAAYEPVVEIAKVARTTSDRLRRLDEPAQVILALWTEEKATFDGIYYQLREAVNEPKGVQKPHAPVLIAGGREKMTLRVVAKYADACNIIDSPAFADLFVA